MKDSGRENRSKLYIVILATSLIALATPRASSGQQFYFKSNCVSQIELDEQCNISFMRESVNIRFGRGTAENIKFKNILAWNYTDSSKLKIDTELASKIGIIGFLFKKVVHRHVFSIKYKDSFGDSRNLIINFSDSQYVNPMLGALRDRIQSSEIN